MAAVGVCLNLGGFQVEAIVLADVIVDRTGEVAGGVMVGAAEGISRSLARLVPVHTKCLLGGDAFGAKSGRGLRVLQRVSSYDSNDGASGARWPSTAFGELLGELGRMEKAAEDCTHSKGAASSLWRLSGGSTSLLKVGVLLTRGCRVLPRLDCG